MLEIVEPGLETCVQDYPGRIGYWAQGFPPSGPLDSWSFRLANRRPEKLALERRGTRWVTDESIRQPEGPAVHRARRREALRPVADPSGVVLYAGFETGLDDFEHRKLLSYAPGAPNPRIHSLYCFTENFWYSTTL